MSGIFKLVRFKLWAKLKAGDVEGAAHEFLDINKAGGVEVKGLTLRRKAEAKLFLSQVEHMCEGLVASCTTRLRHVGQKLPLPVWCMGHIIQLLTVQTCSAMMGGVLYLERQNHRSD